MLEGLIREKNSKAIARLCERAGQLTPVEDIELTIRGDLEFE